MNQILVVGMLLLMTVLASTCRERGLDPDTLLCGVCHKLRDFDTLEQECLSCCTKLYTKARLEYPQVPSPDVVDFIRNRLNKFSSRDVEAIPARRGETQTRLKLVHDGSPASEIRISRWNANDIEEFLGQYFPRTS